MKMSADIRRVKQRINSAPADIAAKSPTAEPAAPVDTVRHMIAEFLTAQRAKRRSPATIEYYRSNCAKFAWFLEAQVDPPVTDIRMVTPSHVRAFFSYLDSTSSGRFGSAHPRAQVPLKPGAVQAIARAVRAFLNFCYKELELRRDPLHNVQMPSVPKQRVRVLSDDELIHVFNAISELGSPFIIQRTRAFFMLAFDTGLRAAELLALDHSHFAQQDHMLRIAGGKGDKSREVIIGYFAWAEMTRYFRLRRNIKGPSDKVFVQESGKPCTYGTMKNIVRRINKKIEAKTGVDPNIHLHLLRHTFATRSLRAGMSTPLLKHVLGHASITTTEKHYIGLDEDDVRDAARFSPADAMLRNGIPWKYKLDAVDKLAQAELEGEATKPVGRGRREVILPTPAKLVAEAKTTSMRALARKYGVSEKTIRNRLKPPLMEK